MGRTTGRVVFAAASAVLLVAVGCSLPGSWTVIEPLTRGSTPAPIDVDAFSCGSPTNCVALPVFIQGPAPQPPGFGEAWDGVSWKPIAAPARNLYGLSCAGQFCMAIARPDVEPDAPTRVWTRAGSGPWIEVDDVGDQIVSSVDCASDRHCVAIGSPPEGGTAALVRHWDGEGWTTISDARPSSTWISEVGCLTDGSCVFVTDGNGDGVPYSFERWDGSAWSDLPHVGRLPKAGELSCGPTLATCQLASVWADAAGNERPAFMRWTGTRFEADPFVPDNFIDGVQCTADGRCTAKTHGQTLTWDGASWHAAAAPPEGQELFCGSATTCFLRQLTFGDPTLPPTFFRWDGTSWKPAEIAPNPQISDAALAGVSCPTAGWCLAVGEYKEGADTRPLVEHWDGSAWSLGPDVPVPAGTTVSLTAVSCPAVDRCLAVGSSSTVDGPPTTYVARWDGTTWTDESAAAAAASPIPLNDVSCVGSTCVGVGNAGSSVVAVRSDGSGWTALPPPPGAPVIYPARNAVQVACAAASSCAITSIQFLGGGVGSNLSYWDGNAWSDPATSGGSSASLFLDVACPAAGNCLAVGTDLRTRTGVSATWAGAAWVTQEVAVPLSLVSCATTDRCLAAAGAGPIAPGGASQLSRAHEWDGSTWRQVRAGAPTVPADAIPSDLSCSGRSCVAVGNSTNDPLAYRYRF